jgi:hypothetical protein
VLTIERDLFLSTKCGVGVVQNSQKVLRKDVLQILKIGPITDVF